MTEHCTVTSPQVWFYTQSHTSCPLRAISTDLGGHEVGRVAGGHQKAVVCPQLLSEAKVTNSQAVWGTRVVCIQDIGRFQIPMYNLE